MDDVLVGVEEVEEVVEEAVEEVVEEAVEKSVLSVWVWGPTAAPLKSRKTGRAGWRRAG